MEHLSIRIDQFFNSPFSSAGQEQVIPGVGTVGGSASVFSVVDKVVNGAIGIAGIIMLFLLLGAGWQVIASSGGNPEGMKKAQKTATTAIVGMMVVVFAYFIVRLIETYFFNGGTPLTNPGV